MAKETLDPYWKSVQGTRFWVLAPPGENASDHNVFVEGYGYLDDHIPSDQRRNRPEHWDEQFQQTEAFQKSWQPRHGPLELIDNLARKKQGDESFFVANMGAGLGDFTVNLAQIPKVHVAHVDFSPQANQIATELITQKDVDNKVEVVTATNINYLKHLLREGLSPDFIFLYGGLGENTPQEKTIERTLKLAAKALKPGGHIWYVGLVQPFLEESHNDLVAADILGEYPTRPDLIDEIMKKMLDMYQVGKEIGERPDKHPLLPGGPSQDHLHIILRALYAKTKDGNRVTTPHFGFKDAVDPGWGERWQKITSR